jgi:hypothetical protein
MITCNDALNHSLGTNSLSQPSGSLNVTLGLESAYLLSLQPDVRLPAACPDVVSDPPEGAGGPASLLGQSLAGCGSTVPGSCEGRVVEEGSRDGHPWMEESGRAGEEEWMGTSRNSKAQGELCNDLQMQCLNW